MILQPKISYPDYKWNGSFTYRNKTDLIVWHHSDSNDVSALEINKWHKSNGWIGIGYNFIIHWDGSIDQARPAIKNIAGAHAQGINNRSIGICFTGRYNQPNKMPEKQFNAGVQLTAWLIDNYYNNVEIIGHRDAPKYGGVGSICPGKYFPFDEMKNAVFNLLKSNQEEEKMNKVSDWAKISWNKAVKKGIVDGSNPQNPVTREMMMVILDRLGLIDKK